MGGQEFPQFVIPPAAVEEWTALAAALEGVRVGCQSSTAPESWWETSGFDEAMAVCEGCRVRLECLAYAVAAREEAGVWGGLSPSDRAAFGRGIA